MSKYQPNIKITVQGSAGSGKTNIALLIQDTLKEHGLDIEIYEQYPEGINSNLRSNRKEVFKNIAKTYQGRKIVLDMSIGKRNENYESSFEHVAKEYIPKEYTEIDILEEVKKSNIHITYEMVSAVLERKKWIRKSDLSEILNSLGYTFQDIATSNFITIENYKNGKVTVFKSRYDFEMTEYICKGLGYKNWTFKPK